MRQFFASLSSSAQTQEQKSVKFGFITDIHWALYNNGSPFYYVDGLAQWEEAIAEFNTQQVDFVLNNGDITDGDVGGGGITSTNQQLYMAQMETAAQALTMPYYYTLGNHDMDTGTKADVAANLSIAPPYYYYFDVNGIRFIVLDSCYNLDQDGSDYANGDYYQPPDAADKYIPPTQRAWLQSTLASASGKCVVFAHHPFSEPDGDNEHQINNSDAVRAILENSGKVINVFMGHEHLNGSNLVNGIPYHKMDDTASQNLSNTTYAIIDIDEAYNVKVTGYGTQTSY